MKKKIFAAVLAILTALIAAIYVNHRICSDKEAPLLKEPIGQLVEVDGQHMNVYTEGSGDKTIVFMSGGGTSSPVLDFKSLYSVLSKEHTIVVVEKFGYGFSDEVDKERSIESVLEDTRTALSAAGIKAPYILCPHSMSGLEALYWAKTYPDEVSAVIGLDMAVPEHYDEMNINLPFLKLSQLSARLGLTRILPGVSESDAIKYGTLTEQEKAIYRAVFFKRTLSVTMFNEMTSVKANAEKVKAAGIPELPLLMFLSDGTGTGFGKSEWHEISKKYAAQFDNAEVIELSCPHYVHDYEYDAIADTMCSFLAELSP